MDTNIILITCAIVMVINVFMLYRNAWVFERRTELNKFEGNEHVINQYVDYDTMMNKFWVWDVEKLKVPNALGNPPASTNDDKEAKHDD